MERNRRRLIRRAEQHGYLVETIAEPSHCPDSLVEHLVRLKCCSSERMVHRLGRLCHLAAAHRLATRRRQPGGCSWHIHHRYPRSLSVDRRVGDRAGNMFTGSDPSHADLGANSLLRWRAAQDLHIAV